MYLLIFSTLISFLSASMPTFLNPILKWLNKPTSKEQALHQDIIELQKSQSQLSMVDNFVTHSKLQRKINSLKMELDNTSSNRVGRKHINQFTFTIGTKAILGFLMMFIILYYRYVPVYVFPKNYNFFPLNTVMSYPNNVPGAVSVHFWFVVCNCVARILIK